MGEIGKVIGRASPCSFYIVSAGRPPPVFEYLTYKLNEGGKEVDVVAQVVEPVSESRILTEYTSLEAMEKIMEKGLDSPYHYALVKVLGYLDGEEIKLPRNPPEPGTSVFVADDDLLRRIYSSEKGIDVGHLLTRQGVRVAFDLNGFRRHLAVLAATGAGKSYAAGLIMEKLLERGATVVVIDPHGDYTKMGIDRDGNPVKDENGTPVFWYDRIHVFHVPGEERSYPYENVKEFTVKLKDLGLEILKELMGVRETWTRINEAIDEAYKEIGDDSGVEDLISKLDEMSKSKKEAQGAERAKSYAEKLRNYRVIGKETTSIRECLKPGTLIILDFSGVDDSILDVATRLVLEEIFNCKRRREYRYPVFLFIEEAHRITPADRKTHSSPIVRRIAREGRKFGVFLTIISQRPRSVDQDVLSMCQSFITLRIVNPEDQSAVRRSAEKMSEDLLDNLPGLNVGEAIVTGDLVRLPVIMKFSGRRSDEGGRDIDVERELEEAVDEIRREIELNPRNLPRPEEVI